MALAKAGETEAYGRENNLHHSIHLFIADNCIQRSILIEKFHEPISMEGVKSVVNKQSTSLIIVAGGRLFTRYFYSRMP